MTTKDLILPSYIYIDDKGREVTISKSLKSMDVVIRNEDRTVDHVIFAALVGHPDRITWKPEKFCELSQMDKIILSDVLVNFQQDPKHRQHCEEFTVKRFEYLMNEKHQELDAEQRRIYELLKQYEYGKQRENGSD